MPGAGIGFQGPGHMCIHDQRRIGVGHAVKHRIFRHEFSTEQDARHVNRMSGTLGADKCPHESPVRVPDMGIEHIQMAFVGRHINRLADHPAGMM